MIPVLDVASLFDASTLPIRFFKLRDWIVCYHKNDVVCVVGNAAKMMWFAVGNDLVRVLGFDRIRGTFKLFFTCSARGLRVRGSCPRPIRMDVIGEYYLRHDDRVSL